MYNIYEEIRGHLMSIPDTMYGDSTKIGKCRGTMGFLIRYASACSKYDQFLVRGSLLTNKLMSQRFQLSRLKAAFRKFYGR
jgi:hypothetical protein